VEERTLVIIVYMCWPTPDRILRGSRAVSHTEWGSHGVSLVYILADLCKHPSPPLPTPLHPSPPLPTSNSTLLTLPLTCLIRVFITYKFNRLHCRKFDTNSNKAQDYIEFVLKIMKITPGISGFPVL
jgi:hypothetical protein